MRSFTEIRGNILSRKRMIPQYKTTILDSCCAPHPSKTMNSLLNDISVWVKFAIYPRALNCKILTRKSEIICMKMLIGGFKWPPILWRTQELWNETDSPIYNGRSKSVTETDISFSNNGHHTTNLYRWRKSTLEAVYEWIPFY